MLCMRDAISCLPSGIGATRQACQAQRTRPSGQRRSPSANFLVIFFKGLTGNEGDHPARPRFGARSASWPCRCRTFDRCPRAASARTCDPIASPTGSLARRRSLTTLSDEQCKPSDKLHGSSSEGRKKTLRSMNKLGKNFLTAEARVQAECRNKPLRMARRSNRFLTMSDSDYARKGGCAGAGRALVKATPENKKPRKTGAFLCFGGSVTSAKHHCEIFPDRHKKLLSATRAPWMLNTFLTIHNRNLPRRLRVSRGSSPPTG